ncbi:MAG: Asp-tRNA(Asn)/Glu-tRNA(Gln) amidotransferase subunit GatC [Candidatus Krumholzibacteria bacterium]|nr:Asp-tRNA(Asn)/Glu-tRNA(Gln) amidotransferase subunit GatC [Candidatus Krumholzibacteria bacterium]
MKIDRNTIEHLEALARIELSDEEREKLAGQLDRIVKFVEKLDELDTSGVDTIDESRGSQPVRPDFPMSWLGHQKVLNKAPDGANGFFRVPRVINRGEDD